MKRNELLNYQIKLPQDCTLPFVSSEITAILHGHTHVYSWILYNKTTHYLLSVLVSDNRTYNTILTSSIATTVIAAIETYTDKKSQVITHRQPLLEILCETYKPLIYSLCIQQHNHWPQIELEDLIQMCNLRLCILYQQGYYIHKNLLNRSFINAVLMFLRPERYKPQIISLDQTNKSKSGTDEEVSRIEVIEDESALAEIDDTIDTIDGCTFADIVSQEMRNVVLEFVSQRTYDQWCLEYGTKTVSRATASQVNALKSKLQVLGITRENITDYIIKRR